MQTKLILLLIIGSQKQIQWTETKSYFVVSTILPTKINVVTVANVSLSLVRSNEISRLKNVSPDVSFKGPFVRSYEVSLVSYVTTFTQFFSLLLSTYFQSLLRSYNIAFLST